MNLPQDTYFSIAFIESIQMQEINKKYRKNDSNTDVISFPHKREHNRARIDKLTENYIGEILIDINYIADHCNSHKIKHEIIKTAIHGFLHLIGYDHINHAQNIEMQKQENEIMNEIRMEGFCDY